MRIRLKRHAHPSRITLHLLSAALSLLFIPAYAATTGIPWADLKGLDKVGEGFRTTDADPWLVSAPFSPPATEREAYLLLEARASTSTQMQIFWMPAGEHPSDKRSLTFPVSADTKMTSRVIDLNATGTFDGAAAIRLDPATAPGVDLELGAVRLLSLDAVPAELLPDLIQFRAFTSKLHYRPGERIEYGATLRARNHPEHRSAKVLEVTLRDAADNYVTNITHHFGLAPETGLKELRGVLETSAPLAPGKYRLDASVRDLMTGLLLSSRHDFGIQGAGDPAVFETPFKFVKDFSLVHGPDGRWHIFSITGDFVGTHEWREPGQERTFSHGSSADLRHWEVHPPVLSITDKTYPDGRGRYADRNIWAPHVLRSGDTWYMFYTSVNEHVSQSVSLATSSDLITWKEFEKNPVFTLEDADWALWRRDGWSDCRDPMILEADGRFYLYVTATLKAPDEKGHQGVVAVAESDDLLHWSPGRIAVRGRLPMESPQVWKQGDVYCMLTSSNGAGSFVSDDPAAGWRPADFPRPDIGAVEKYVQTSESYAEEVAQAPDGEQVMGALTWRLFGNSIYLYRTVPGEKGPKGYEPVRW